MRVENTSHHSYCIHRGDRKSTRLNSSHLGISYAVFCLKKKKKRKRTTISPLNKRNREINASTTNRSESTGTDGADRTYDSDKAHNSVVERTEWRVCYGT